MKLDDRDIAIPRVLSTEGRISKAALADRVGLLPTPVWDRLKKLEQAGSIEGYRAEISLRKLGPHVTAFVAAELSDHAAASCRAFEEAVRRYDEVVACCALGGGFHYLMQVIERDIDACQRLMDAMLDARIGRLLYRQSANTVKRLALELGGHAPVIIFKGADMENAVAETMKAKWASGQDCLGANRIYVERPAYDDFCRRFAEATKGLAVGPGMDDCDPGPLMNEKAVAKQEEQVADALARGACLTTGGRRPARCSMSLWC